MMSEEKIFIQPAELLHDSFRLGMKILESGFLPNYIIAIWRGGTPIGIAVQELFDCAGVDTDHIAIRTSYYTGIEKTTNKVHVHGLGYLIDKINYEDCLLIVDDVFDTGKSIAAVIDELEDRARRNLPHDVRVATPWYKPSKNVTEREPDYYIHETERWLVFPHELQGLSLEEVRSGKPEIARFFEEVSESRSVKRQEKRAG